MPRFRIMDDDSSDDDDFNLNRCFEGPSSSSPPIPKKHRRVDGFYHQLGVVEDDDDEDPAAVSENQEDEEQQEDENEEEEDEEVLEEGNWGEEYDSIAQQDDVVMNCNRPGKRKVRDTAGPSGDDGSISVTLTDPDVLDCPICLESFTIPVFQCENGHTACFRCCSKIRNKCPSCSLPIGYNRCRAIEKVLESITTSCRNKKYGCKDTVSYNKKHEHDQMCLYEPCSCPYPGCDFVASSKRVYLHFNSKHPDTATPFCCDSFFHVPIKTDMKFVILQENITRTLFVLNYGVHSIGNVANIICVAPSSLRKGFSYELIASKVESSVKLTSFTESMPRWCHHLPRKEFLLIPSDFYLGSFRVDHFKVCIRRRIDTLSFSL